jgi:polyhydroxybutyrate depolymerase
MRNWIAAMPGSVRIYWLTALLIGLSAFVAVVSLLHWGAANETSDARYPEAVDSGGSCAQGPRSGRAGRHEGRTAGGVSYVVVTPRNYRPAYAHPLMVVYAPAGFDAGLSERYSGLTGLATAAGFVVTYVDSLQLSLDVVDKFAAVPTEVAAAWCIDPARLYATGHSDGGTVSVALAALAQYHGRFAAIAASGVGWQTADFAELKCPAPMPVMILHGAADTHFPGFGHGAAAWWSACNHCTSQGSLDANACRAYSGCAAETVYCEPDRSHWRWAGDPQTIVQFLARQAEPGGGVPR